MAERKFYPMYFAPFAEYVSWGGGNLAGRFGKKFDLSKDGIPVGESWELADMGFRDSVIANGWLSGDSISDVLDTYMERIVGDNVFEYYGRQFPLLLKFIDVKGRTPVMVHPDDEIASQRYDALGKQKLWYIVSADRNAEIRIGLESEMAPGEFYLSCMDGTVADKMTAFKPEAGDCFIIPSGVMHYAASGVVIAEIAEASDLDFKIYNWGLPTENDLDEPLGLAEAFDFLKLEKYDTALYISAGSRPHDVHHDHDDGHGQGGPVQGHGDMQVDRLDRIARKLVDIPEFSVTELHLTDAIHNYTQEFGSFITYMCVSGEVSLQMEEDENGGKVNRSNILKAGQTVLIPAESPDFLLVPMAVNTVLLEATVGKREQPDSYLDDGQDDDHGHIHDDGHDHVNDYGHDHDHGHDHAHDCDHVHGHGDCGCGHDHHHGHDSHHYDN